MKSSKTEYCSGYPFPSPGNPPNPGIKPRSPTLQVDSLPAEPWGKPKNTAVGSLSLSQQIFLTQEENWGLLHHRQMCLTLWNPMNYTVHGILQARILEWIAVPFSRASSQPRDWIQVSLIAGRFFTSWATRESLKARVSYKRRTHNIQTTFSCRVAEFLWELKTVQNEHHAGKYSNVSSIHSHGRGSIRTQDLLQAQCMAGPAKHSSPLCLAGNRGALWSAMTGTSGMSYLQGCGSTPFYLTWVWNFLVVLKHNFT